MIRLALLLGLAREIVHSSTAVEAQVFDVGAWFGRWLETDSPALGGVPPSEMIRSPSGYEAVRRTLGAIQSGSYV